MIGITNIIVYALYIYSYFQLDIFRYFFSFPFFLSFFPILSKMELSTLLFTLISGVIVYIFFNQRKKSQFPNNSISLPGPKPLPIIGNLHQIKDVPIQNFIDKFSNYGPIFKVHYGAETWIILNDYEIIRDLLVKRGAIYSSRPVSF
jgi:hypothetical protein